MRGAQCRAPHHAPSCLGTARRRKRSPRRASASTVVPRRPTGPSGRRVFGVRCDGAEAVGLLRFTFRGGRVARVARASRRREHRRWPRDAVEKETRHVPVVPVGRPRDAPFASIASAADVASLEAMRAELDSTSSALEDSDARERLLARRLQTARVGAGVARYALDALNAVAASRKIQSGPSSLASGRRHIRRPESVPSPSLSIRQFGRLSESIARALEPVRAFDRA